MTRRGLGTARGGKPPDKRASRRIGRLFPCPWQTSPVSPAAPGSDGNSAVGAGEALDNESLHGAILTKYNELLAEATTRLQASLERINEKDLDTGMAGLEKLIRKIRELIDYLEGARL